MWSIARPAQVEPGSRAGARSQAFAGAYLPPHRRFGAIGRPGRVPRFCQTAFAVPEDRCRCAVISDCSAAPVRTGRPQGECACSHEWDRGATTAVVWCSGCGCWCSCSVASCPARSATAFRDEFNLPDVESKHGLRHPRRRVRRPGDGHRRHDRVPGRAGRRRPRGPAGDAGALRRGRRRSKTSYRVESPYADGGARTDLVAGPRGGQDRLRQRRDARRHRLRPRRRDPRRDPRRRCRRSTGCEIELGGFIFAEFEQPSSEVLGLAFAIVILIVAFGSVLAMGLPVGVALFGIGIGTAHHHAAQQRPHDPRLRHLPRHHDRPRRRHRLRAADRHPLPRAAPRRAHACASRSPSPSTPPAVRCCSPASPW